MSIIVGQRFMRWTVVQLGERKGKHPAALCVCECGTERVIRIDSLGKTSTSCGCLQRELASAARTKANTTHGLSRTPQYRVWSAMLSRCYCETSSLYKWYGARGIKVCERWQNSYENFLADMGNRPTGGELERIDNDGNYEPTNCRWATRRQQSQNTRRNYTITYCGQTYCLSEWARRLGINPKTLHNRIYSRGWDDVRALTTPVKPTPAR
jgi:hypothetical protein